MKMKGLLFWPVTLVWLAYADDFSPPNSKANSLRLWYSTSGALWNDSMPIGNGRLGGMIRGVVSTELISMNEDSLWSGTLLDRLNPSASDSLSRIKPWLLQGDISDAEFEANLGISGVPSSTRVFIPGGDLQIVFQNQSSPENFERWLDLGDGTSGVFYTAGSVTYKREYFASNPSDILAVRLTASSPGALSFYIKFQRPSDQQNRFAESSTAQNSDTIITNFISGQIQAVFGARVHIIGGSKRQIGDQIQVFGADEAWIYCDIETSVRQANPQSQVESKLASAISSNYPALRQAHVDDYQKLFNRTSLNLGLSNDQQKALSTDARRNALGDGGFDPELVALYFQYGRYLLISSSRDGYYPATLQGIWNSDFNPAWGSKYTININLQMNYWPAEVTNLQELTEPLFSHIEKMHSTGTTTARQMYQASGWCAHHNTDLWGDTAPQDIYAQGAYWPMGGAWLLSHVYEHYRFTGDINFLAKYYNIMYDAVRFYQDFLVDYNGWKVTAPSVSPENSYINGTISGSMTIGSTIDNSILWELFGNLLEAAEVLGKSVANDETLQAAQTLRAQLPPLRVSPTTNVLMEWIADFTETDPGHRHMSPLYGLFPSHEITPENTTIWNAASDLLARRVSHGSGTIGWSRAWIMALHARLFDGTSIETDITTLLYNLTYNSLLDSGPPAGFQIDGNFGGCAGIAESLLQSHNNLVNILPALMPSSKSGSFNGLVARGGFVVDAVWSNGMLVNATILSRLGNPLNVTVGTAQSIMTNGNGTGTGTGNGTTGSFAKWISMKTAAGKTYVFVADSA